MNPLRFPPAATFADLRALLVAHDYLVEPVCLRTGSPSIYELRTRPQGGQDADEPADALDILVRLFLDSGTVGGESMLAHLGADGVRLLEECGLVAASPSDSSRRVGTVLLYPTEGLWIASDRSLPPDLEAGRVGLPEDVVYPAVTGSVRVFMGLLPRNPCGSFLELCAGTGVAALAAAHEFAASACAVDITHRATVFARFNAALNALDARVTALEGDLWEPVAGRRFDRIAAHPPYVAAPRTEYVYRDGGADGEWVTRRILAGAKEHLNPGGMLHCTCMLTHRTGTTLPDRVREMLGPDADAFDLLVVDCGRASPAEHFADRLMKARGDGVLEVAEHFRHFRTLKVESLVFTTLLLRLHGEDRPGATALRTVGPATRGAHMLWGIEMAMRGQDPRFPLSLLSGRPRLSPVARMKLRYRVGEGEEEAWVPETARVEVSEPFLEGMEATLAVARFLGRCDGTLPLAELMERVKEEGLLEPEVSLEDFAGMVARLVSLGVLLWVPEPSDVVGGGGG